MEEQRWTLDELAERVDDALAVDYQGQPSGRVRAVPDRRAIRWYTTIGLIDRPVAHRGRTALYGPRHLLQLVAVKRLQAEGRPLVAIQQQLAGATDTQLARVARLPAGPAPSGGARPAARGRASRRSRAAAPSDPAGPRLAATRSAAAGSRAGFWRGQPALAPAAMAAAEGGAPTAPSAEGAQAPALPAALATPVAATAAVGGAVPDDPATGSTRVGGVATLQGIRLGEGATLLLEPGRALDAADLDAVLDAAGPLLAALRDRGLGGAGTAGRDPDPRDPGGIQRRDPGGIQRRDPGPRDPDSRRPPRDPGLRRAGGNEPRREQP
jgi:DNA-binding transcriptional MerR regulator